MKHSHDNTPRANAAAKPISRTLAPCLLAALILISADAPPLYAATETPRDLWRPTEPVMPFFPEEILEENNENLRESDSEIPPAFNFTAFENDWLIPADLVFSEETDAPFWQDQEAHALASLFRDARLVSDSPTLLQAARPMLLAPISHPEVQVERLLRLYDLGDIAAINRIFEILPILLSAPRLERMRVREALSSGAMPRACGLANAIRSEQALEEELDADDFTLTLQVVCQFLEGREDAAQMTADLMRENDRGPDMLIPFLLAASGADMSLPPSSAEDEIMFAFTRALGRAPPLASVADAEPAFLMDLARDEFLSDASRMIAGGRAWARGLLPIGALTRLFLENLGDPADPNLAPLARAALIEGALDRAEELAPSSYMAALHIYAPYLAEIVPRAELIGIAHRALHAFLLTEDEARLAQWVDVIVPAASSASPSEEGARARDVRRRAAIFFSERAQRDAWQRVQERRPPLPRELWELVSTALHALAPSAAGDIPRLSLASQPRRGAAILLARLKEDADQKRESAVIFRVLALLKERDLADADPVIFAEILKALQRSGLERMARRLAIEVIVTHEIAAENAAFEAIEPIENAPYDSDPSDI